MSITNLWKLARNLGGDVFLQLKILVLPFWKTQFALVYVYECVYADAKIT